MIFKFLNMQITYFEYEKVWGVRKINTKSLNTIDKFLLVAVFKYLARGK